ncbi:hypothetical protein EMIHUDRAFT_237285 [Emiliania huxleyi CCMP1516]|uniref:Amino acid transporter transmembrane domain-containing protein n=2 Tax=Emiliania huxleyi TaxID=2903 RepID=A0A0D3JR70_EMIH1|nr:hypothetical protein EMIHUDRAFT_237285 [Emiliania huxleyi CCMP1516]EOD26005.1 hypothetical protein EMIHUDRAFT_237285 [Emiliania huxleyi CCMP1516]|eukprot:XP_005778434.1 hypothetical protein EMIHUDRAFT_237285 [Emiliania huxleyi CCMP1516]
MPDNVGSLPPAVGDASPARHAGRNITPAEAVVHLMKGNLGPGVLALPLQFVRVGPSIGLCILAVVGVQGVYCMWLIVATQHAAHFRGRASGTRRVPSTKALSFEDLGWLAFGTPGRCVVQAAAVTLAYLACAALSLLPSLADLWEGQATSAALLQVLSAFGTAAMFFALGSASTAAVFRLEHAAAAEAIDATLPAPLGGYLPSNLSSPLLQEPSPPAAEGGASFTAIGGAAASCFYALEGVSMVLPVGNALAPEPHPRGCYALVLSLTNLATLIDLVGAVANTVLAALPSAIHAKLLLSRAALREPADTVRLNGDAAALPEPRPCHRRLARALSRLWSEVARRSGGGGGSRDDVAPLSTPAGATCDASLEASDANRQRGRAPDRFPRLSHAELLSLATDALIICFCALVMCAGLYHAATAPTPSNPGEPATNNSMVAHPVTRE